MKTDEQKKKVLSKLMISCGAAFITIPGCVRPAGGGVDSPEGVSALRTCSNPDTFAWVRTICFHFPYPFSLN